VFGAVGAVTGIASSIVAFFTGQATLPPWTGPALFCAHAAATLIIAAVTLSPGIPDPHPPTLAAPASPPTPDPQRAGCVPAAAE
jgi:hypothetical protein